MLFRSVRGAVKAVGGAVAHGVKLAAPQFLGGGKQLYENRAFRTALGDNPALMQQAVDLLNQGKTIQEVAVELQSPSLAAFAKNAEAVFGSKAPEAGDIQRQFVLQENARRQAQANQLAAAQQGLAGVQSPLQQQAQAAAQEIAAAQGTQQGAQRVASAIDQYRAQQLAGLQEQVNQLAPPQPTVNALRMQTPEATGEATRAAAEAAEKAVKTPIQERINAAIEAAKGTETYVRPMATAAQAILAEPISQVMPSLDRKSTRLNSSHVSESRMPSSA